MSGTLSPARPGFDFSSLTFLLVALISGLAGALQAPALSLFLTSEIHVRPFMVGLFYTANALVGIVVSQLLAHYSDRLDSRKMLIIGCCLLGAGASVLFAWNRNYYLLLIFGIFFASFGASATSQMFAMAREYSDRTGRESAFFGSLMRAQISVAWMISPPLAFALALGYSFSAMYLTAALMFMLCALVVQTLLPAVTREPQAAEAPLVEPRQNRHATLLLFIACALMWASNGLYLIAMPLYVVQDLLLPEKLAGTMMGVAAGLEIPVMLLAGYYVRQLGKRPIMLLAAIAGTLFYAGTLLVCNALSMLLLQGLNAIFIGILAAMGMLYFQDMMPGQAGAATTLFSNAIRLGWIIGGSLVGVVAEFWHWQQVFWLALVMMLAALICLWRVPEPGKK